MKSLLLRLLATPVRVGGVLDVPLSDYLADVQAHAAVQVFASYARAHAQPTLRTILADERFVRWTAAAGTKARAPVERELAIVEHVVDEEYILDEEELADKAPELSLDAWAEVNGVSARLLDSLSVLVPNATREQCRALSWLKGNIRSLASGQELASIEDLSPALRASLIELAVNYVHAAGERNRVEREEDARVEALRFVPTGVQSAAFLQALDAALARTRRHRVYQGEVATVAFQRDARVLEMHWTISQTGHQKRNMRASLALQNWQTQPLDRAVRTTANGRNLATIDYVLRAARRAIADPQHPAHNGLARYLDEPAWERTVAAIDALGLTQSQRQAANARIEWCLSNKPLQLTPSLTSALGTTKLDLSSVRQISRGASARDEAVVQALEEPMYVYHTPGRQNDARQRIFQALRLLQNRSEVVDRARNPIAVHEGSLTVALEETSDGVQFGFRLDGDCIEASVIQSTLDNDGYLIHFDERISKVAIAHVGSLRAAVLLALTREVATFPHAARAQLLQRVSHLAPHIQIDVPDSILGEDAGPADPQPTLRLVRTNADVFALSWSVVPVRGGSSRTPGEGSARTVEYFGDRIAVAVRDLAEESRRLAVVHARLPRATRQHDNSAAYHGLELCLEVVSVLRAVVAADEANVMWPKQVPRVIGDASFSKLQISIGARGDWFGVEGKLDAGDGYNIPLATLLAAARARQKYVSIGADSFVRIEADLQAKLLAIADATRTDRVGLRVARVAVPALLGALGSRKGLDAAPEFWALVARIDAAYKKDAAVPRRFQPILRDYQVEGYRWMSRLAAWGAGACLADEMGLGKTVQALALLLARKSLGPAMVVAPTSVGPNWLTEAQRFAPALRCILHRGKERASALSALVPGDVLVTSYDLLARDSAELAQVEFGTLILDEAQAIKTGTTARARAARSIRAAFRVALSGTPVENRLSELYSLMEFLNPGLLGSADEFRADYVIPIERDRNPEKAAALAQIVRPFLLRRRKREVAAELPARTEVTRLIERSAEEGALYEAARRLALAAAANADDGARFQVLAEIMRLRRLACHPQLFDAQSAVPSAKLAAFVTLAEELREEGHRALVFSQFTGHLALVAEALRVRNVSFQYLDGSTPLSERTKRIKAFQGGEGALFLISLKAGGTGLNLTAADTVIHLDPWWNPAVEDQATDRAHRIGQTKPVTVIRLIAQGTIEEAVLALHAGKRELAESILEGSAASGKLSMNELADLIRSGMQS